MKIKLKQPYAQSFGQALSSRRIWLKIGLRELAGKFGIDPGNLSKIEKGTLPPPRDFEVLSKWAGVLGIEKDSRLYYPFIDCAYITQGLIPPYLPKNELLIELPLFFRDMRNKRDPEREWKKLSRGLPDWDV